MNGYDHTHYDALSGKELTRLDAGEELHRTTLETYDSDNDGLISKQELYKLAKKEGDTIFKVCFKGSGTSTSDLEEALLFEESLPEIITQEYILKHVKKGDDDAVDLSFQEIWSILRNVHNDFTSVYQSFIKKYPQLKDEIDAIFIKHGFFIETQKGNNQWDFSEPFRDLNSNVIYDKEDFFIDYPENGFSYNKGETIGSAGDYNRQDRRSFAALPGHYIQTNNEVPFYHVEVSLYDEPFLYYAFPSLFYEYETMNVDGLIYVPIPPVDYHAIMNITGIDVITGNPLIIEAEDFYDNYDEVIEQGYYLSHDFEISGEIPDYPVDPFIASSDSYANDRSSPGFEIILLICSLFLIFFLRKKAEK